MFRVQCLEFKQDLDDVSEKKTSQNQNTLVMWNIKSEKCDCIK